MTETKKQYVAALVDDVVYGVGATKTEAEADAIYWYGRTHPSNAQNCSEYVKPPFEFRPCTEAAFDELYENGWSKLIRVAADGVSLKMELV